MNIRKSEFLAHGLFSGSKCSYLLLIVLVPLPPPHASQCQRFINSVGLLPKCLGYAIKNLL